MSEEAATVAIAELRVTERWLYPPERDQPRAEHKFDPRVEGARYRLGDDVLLAVWQRTCQEVEHRGPHDLAATRQRFHEIAARTAASGGWLVRDVGRLTRVALEQGAIPAGLQRTGWSPAPGRETLVEAEARRWSTMTRDHTAVATPSAVQRKADHVPSAAEVAAAERETTGPGHPLPQSVRRIMEHVFGVDFSAVRVHVGPEAAAIGALAYARGNDIYFSPGHYDPESHSGLALLGHELAHVVQQAQGRVQPTTHASGIAINDSTGLEREADELGAYAVLAARDALGNAPHAARDNDDGTAKAGSIYAYFGRGTREVGPRAGEESLKIDANPRIGSKISLHGSTVVSPALRGQPQLPPLVSGGGRVAQLQVDDHRVGSPPPGTRSERRGQVLARLLEEWRAAGLLDPPARPPDVAEFPPIAPAHAGAMRASDGQTVIAGAAPALRPGPAPGPGFAPGPARPPLRVIPGGEGAPTPAPEVRPPLSPALAGIAVFVVVMLWPRETAAPWMDDISPLTDAPYGSREEYDWTRRLSPTQVDYLRKLRAEFEKGPHAAPVAPPVPVLDGDEKPNKKLPAVNFYHGTDMRTATRMVGGEPIAALGRGEFGKGFYTFVVEAAAAEAAELYTRGRNAGFTEWGVVDFAVPAEVMAEFYTASSIAALLEGKLSRVLTFPDKTTRVSVRYPHELGGAELALTWTEFVEANAKLRKGTAWPYDLIIGPLKGKLRSQKAGIDQWVFGDHGVMVFNAPNVKRRIALSGRL